MRTFFSFPEGVRFVWSVGVLAVMLLQGLWVCCVLFFSVKRYSTLRITAELLFLLILYICACGVMYMETLIKRGRVPGYEWLILGHPVMAGLALCCAARTLWCLGSWYRQYKTHVSVLSMGEAIDTLSAGILYYDRGGRILLINQNMEWLMRKLTGRFVGNGAIFCRFLEEHVGEEYFCPEQNKTWYFTNKILDERLGSSVLIATDVTRQWMVNKELEKQNRKEKEKGKKLKGILDNMAQIRGTEELLRAKSRVHDVMGQRITIMQRLLQREEGACYEELAPYVYGLLDEVRREDTVVPGKRLYSLGKSFGSIGVHLAVKGELPEKREPALLVVDIIREAATNAVRHGLASEVSVCMEYSDEKDFCLRIKDNGYGISGALIERGGLGGMREKIESSGGYFIIEERQPFTICAKWHMTERRMSDIIHINDTVDNTFDEGGAYELQN